MQRRTDRGAYVRAASGTRSIAAGAVGPGETSVGCSRVITSNTLAGAGRPGNNTVVAATWNGKYRALPRPYAKNSLATENVRSSGPSYDTGRPNASQQNSMS